MQWNATGSTTRELGLLRLSVVKLLSIVAVATLAVGARASDFTNATIVVTSECTTLTRNVADLLAGEVFKRTFVRWPVHCAPNGFAGDDLDSASPGIQKRFVVLNAIKSVEVDRASAKAEGYTVAVNATGAFVTATDERGLLFGVGRLIRSMNLSITENYYDARQVELSAPDGLAISSAPKHPMRGVQVGYRPKTNSYDGLTPELFEQFAIDLALFGVNQIELIPHAFDDAPYSPHYALSHKDMNTAMSATLAKYGLNVSLWYPACDPTRPHDGCQKGDYRNATVMAAAVADWTATFSSMGRVDTLFVNAGDPGGQNPDDLIMIAKTAFDILQGFHPNADIWICPQDWLAGDYARWAVLAALPSTQKWLAGVVYGPGQVVSLRTFAADTRPAVYPVRLYPDVTHSLSDQLPVPNWDPAFAFAQNREPVNPRPTQHTAIAATQLALVDAGVGMYNEGCHDDINKIVWATVAWGCDEASPAEAGEAGAAGAAECDSDTLVRSTLRDYTRVHFGAALQDLVLEGIYGLERDWVGELVGNPAVNETLAIFTEVCASCRHPRPPPPGTQHLDPSDHRLQLVHSLLSAPPPPPPPPPSPPPPPGASQDAPPGALELAAAAAHVPRPLRPLPAGTPPPLSPPLSPPYRRCRRALSPPPAADAAGVWPTPPRGCEVHDLQALHRREPTELDSPEDSLKGRTALPPTPRPLRCGPRSSSPARPPPMPPCAPSSPSRPPTPRPPPPPPRRYWTPPTRARWRPARRCTSRCGCGRRPCSNRCTSR
jgi:hypothetical protein